MDIFEQVVLWHTTSIVGGEETVVAFTLKSLLFICVGGFAAYITARRLPAFIEMVLLNRINMSNGSRYAITTLMSYALLGLAVSFIGNSIDYLPQAQLSVACLEAACIPGSKLVVTLQWRAKADNESVTGAVKTANSGLLTITDAITP
mgnify:CR=1 FL=1